MTTAPEIRRLGLMGALQKMVDIEFAQSFDEVEWRIEPGVEEPISQMTPLAAETIYYATRELVRNAAKYARSDAPGDALHVTISAHIMDSEFRLSVQDNGIGFNQGESDGHGLVLHSTMMAIAGGSLALESSPGGMTRAELLMPLES